MRQILSIYTLLIISLGVLAQDTPLKRSNQWSLTTHKAINQNYGSLWLIHNHSQTEKTNHKGHNHIIVSHPKKSNLPALKKSFYYAGAINLELGLISSTSNKPIEVKLTVLDQTNNIVKSKTITLKPKRDLGMELTTISLPTNSKGVYTLVVEPKVLNKEDELYVNLKNL